MIISKNSFHEKRTDPFALHFCKVFLLDSSGIAIPPNFQGLRLLCDKLTVMTGIKCTLKTQPNSLPEIHRHDLPDPRTHLHEAPYRRKQAPHRGLGVSQTRFLPGKRTRREAKLNSRIPLIIAPKPSTSSPPTRISRKSAIQAHCLHEK